MSVDASVGAIAEGFASRLGQHLRDGTILDCEEAAIPADLLRSVLLGKPPAGHAEPVVLLADVDPRGLLITNARIQGRLDLRNATISSGVTIIKSTVSDGIDLRGARLSRELDLRGSTVSTLYLTGAAITGSLRLSAVQLTGSNQDGDSLVGDNLQVDGSAFLNQGFTTVGAVRLLGAHITRALDMSGAQLTARNQDGDSLVADNLQVDGSAFLNQGFTAAGAVRLPGAHITGQLGMHVKGIRPDAVDSPGLDLTAATVDDLRINLKEGPWIDQPKVRPDPPSLPVKRVVLSLENCTYKHRPDPDLGSLETWLRVLRFHTPDYQPRSYQNLAAAHRATGHDRDAGRILMAQQDHRRATALRPKPNSKTLHRAGLWTTRTGLFIWKATLGYGYRPRRALAWLLALLATAGVLVTVAAHWQADPNTPDVPVAYRPANPDTGTPLGYCSAGEAAGLAVRIAIPLVTNLGQGACIINTASTPGSVVVAVSIALQTFAWILGGLTIAAAATAIKRSP